MQVLCLSSTYYSISGSFFLFLVNKQFLQVLIGSIDIHVFDTLVYSNTFNFPQIKARAQFWWGYFFFIMASGWTN